MPFHLAIFAWGLVGAESEEPAAFPELRMRIEGGQLEISWLPPALPEKLADASGKFEAVQVIPDYEIQASRDLVHWETVVSRRVGGLGRLHPSPAVKLPMEDAHVFFRVVGSYNTSRFQTQKSRLRDRRIQFADASPANPSPRLMNAAQTQAGADQSSTPALSVTVTVRDGKDVTSRRFQLFNPFANLQ